MANSTGGEFASASDPSLPTSPFAESRPREGPERLGRAISPAIFSPQMTIGLLVAMGSITSWLKSLEIIYIWAVEFFFRGSYRKSYARHCLFLSALASSPEGPPLDFLTFRFFLLGPFDDLFFAFAFEECLAPFLFLFFFSFAGGLSIGGPAPGLALLPSSTLALFCFFLFLVTSSFSSLALVPSPLLALL